MHSLKKIHKPCKLIRLRYRIFRPYLLQYWLNIFERKDGQRRAIIGHDYMPQSMSKCNTRVKNPAHRAGLLDCRGRQNFNFHLLASTLPTRQGLWRAMAVKDLIRCFVIKTLARSV